jgi:CelD/BcsL family acetyltransferase involved in cellulose biosynthesis
MRFDLTPADDISSEWDELAESVGASPFHRPGWFQAWDRAFGRGRLRALTIRRQGRLAALLPLDARLGRLRSPTNWHSPLFGILARDADSAQDLAKALLDRWAWLTDLSFLLEDDPGMVALLQKATSRRWRAITRTLVRSPYLEIDGDWERYQTSVGKKLMEDVRRRQRRLAEEGRVRFDVRDGSESLAEQLEEGLRVEAQGWKGKERTAIASQPETAQFYGEVARWAAERGILRLLFLRIDDKAIAFQFTLEENGVQYLLKSGYDDAFARYSPGKLIKYEALARAFAIGLRAYDFCGEESVSKQEWTRQVRSRVRIQVFAPTTGGWLGHLAFSRARPMAKGLLGRAQSPESTPSR